MPIAFDLDAFADDYLTASSKFLDACAGRAGKLSRFEHPDCRIDGQALTTDVFYIGAESASKLLVLISATHGVEGFAGSAIQLDTLRTLSSESLPDDVAVLFIHALNPHGFAWLRRVPWLG